MAPIHMSLVGSLACLLIASHAPAVEFYVSPTGDDGNDGTGAKPFKTLEAARDAVRKAKGAGGATVYLVGGRHFRTRSFELDARDSGSAAAPVVYKAPAGRPVALDGGKIIPPSACKPVTDKAVTSRLVAEARDKVRRIDLKALGITHYGTLGPRGFARDYIPAPLELFINSRAQQVARWPNAGQPHVPLGKVVDAGSVPRKSDFTFRGGVFEAGVDRVRRWTKAKNLYVSGIFNYGFADDTIPVRRIDAKARTIHLAYPHLYGLARRGFTTWYALNLIEEIDSPGEFCVDGESGVLYFYPPCDLGGAQIQISLLARPMVVLAGASHVHFEGLVFENSRGTGIYIEGGKANLVAGCTLRNLGIVAVQIGQGASPLPQGRHNAHGVLTPGTPWKPISRELGSFHNYIYAHTAWNRNGGTGHGVRSCTIHDTGAGGVVLGGGDRKTLTPAGNFVENCDIHHVNRWDRMYKTPVNIDGVGNRITHNHLHHCPGQAVLLHGNDHVIEYNRMNHVVTDMSDQAAIYMGRDPSESGNVIRHNFFHDIYSYHAGGHGTQAIFFDDCCTFGATVAGNVFYKTGNTGVIKFHRGGASPIVNNIMIDCPIPVQRKGDATAQVTAFMKSELGLTRLRKAVDITKPPYSTKYPLLVNIYTGKAPVTTPFERNYVVKGDMSQFVNAKGLNFQLKEGSKVYADIPGFKRIPFEKIGLYLDAHRRSLPLSAPRISPAGGVFFTTQSIELAPAPADAARKDVVIRCTTDGSCPTARSPLYRGAIVLNRTATVRARAFPAAGSQAEPSCPASATYRKTTALYLHLMSELDALAHQGLKKGTNYAGTGPASLGGKEYPASLMTCPAAPAGQAHATYDLTKLGKNVTRFKAAVGIEDTVGRRGSAVFIVEVVRGGKASQVFKSATLRGRAGPVVVDVDITGAERLRLRTTDGGDNIHADHAVWADARLE